MEFLGGVLRNRVAWALNRNNSSSGQLLIGGHCLKPLVFCGQVAASLSAVVAGPSP